MTDIRKVLKQHEIISISMRLANMSLMELSRQSGVNPGNLSDITRGRRTATPTTLLRIANVLPAVRNAYFGAA
jgi:transcriptional regulator with XRE-family HTH domain